MKLVKYLFLIITFLGVLIFESHSQLPPPGTYITNSNLDKFVGTWQWTSGSKVVTIKLAKFKCFIQGPDYYEDALYGCHEFSINGTAIESSLLDFNVLTSSIKGTINLFNEASEGSTVAYGTLKDITRSKTLELNIEYIAGTPPQLQWKSQPYEGLRVNEMPGQTLPKNLILTKQ